MGTGVRDCDGVVVGLCAFVCVLLVTECGVILNRGRGELGWGWEEVCTRWQPSVCLCFGEVGVLRGVLTVHWKGACLWLVGLALQVQQGQQEELAGVIKK